MKKGQKLDEGVPRASDQRSQRELLESASPVAFAKIRTYASSTRHTNSVPSPSGGPKYSLSYWFSSVLAVSALWDFGRVIWANEANSYPIR